MRVIVSISVAVLCLLPFAAGAQNGYVPYTAEGFGFTVSVPDSGSIARPGSDGWDREEEVAFEWYGDGTDPVKLIMARVDDAGATLDEASFRAFTDELLSYWSPRRPAGDSAEDADDAPASSNFEVINTADNLVIGGRKWNLIEVEDKSDKQTTVYYSVFSTWEGSKIYTLTFYYLQPSMEQVQTFGKPVLQGFKAAR
jgi:hypothetical protein